MTTTKRYLETIEAQHEFVMARYASVKQYLSAAADMAASTRIAAWELPKGMSAEAYCQHTPPLRTTVAHMLGYPPPGTPVHAGYSVEQLGADDDGAFYRIDMPLLDEGLHASGVLIRPAHPVPGRALAVAIHGGAGTPEAAAGILEPGSYNYHDMGRRLARRGHMVWMPACYEKPFFDPQFPDIDVHRELDRLARMVGSSLCALNAYTIITSTRVLLAAEGMPHAIAVGLSYGGYRALVATALSEIFCACVSSCIFDDRRAKLERKATTGQQSDMYFRDLLRIATDVELCALICPRPLFIEMGAHDAIIPPDGALRVYPDVEARYHALGCGERFAFDLFDGGHEFSGVKALDFLTRLGL